MAVEEQETMPVVYLYNEGNTELAYLQSLAKGREIKIIRRPSVTSPQILLRRALDFAVEQKDFFKDNPKAEIWVVFDNDSKARELDECKSLWLSFRDREAVGRVNVALMSPCIEIWGLLCTDEGSRLEKFSENRHELQRVLHKVMPRYDHDRGAKFDVEKMTSTDVAIKRAKAWARTHGDFPECLNAPHYAGISLLVEKILASPIVSDERSWRRR